MARRRFTDRFVRTLRPAPQGRRVEYWDSLVPSFGVRVTDRGHKTYILYLRWPGKRTATRREIGNVDRLPLADARQVAREWLRLVELGVDPHEQRRAAEAEVRQKKQTTFEAVADAWFRESVARMVKADEIERAVTLEFVDRWRGRPITSITTLEVRDIVKNKAVGLAPAPNAKKKACYGSLRPATARSPLTSSLSVQHDHLVLGLSRKDLGEPSVPRREAAPLLLEILVDHVGADDAARRVTFRSCSTMKRARAAGASPRPNSARDSRQAHLLTLPAFRTADGRHR
jgi:hypothetical protein